MHSFQKRDLLTFIEDPALDELLFNIQVKTVACCRNFADRKFRKHKQ